MGKGIVFTGIYLSTGQDTPVRSARGGYSSQVRLGYPPIPVKIGGGRTVTRSGLVIQGQGTPSQLKLGYPLVRDGIPPSRVWLSYPPPPRQRLGTSSAKLGKVAYGQRFGTLPQPGIWYPLPPPSARSGWDTSPLARDGVTPLPPPLGQARLGCPAPTPQIGQQSEQWLPSGWCASGVHVGELSCYPLCCSLFAVFVLILHQLINVNLENNGC